MTPEVIEGHTRPLLCYRNVVEFKKTFRSSKLVTTLTNVPMDKICPCSYSNNQFIRKANF